MDAMSDCAMKAQVMKPHPAACIFPMLSDDDLASLAEDIRQFGLRQPIIIHDGKILDGRNRWRACQIARVTPITKNFDGTPKEALDFVWSMNARRRDLTPGQKASANAEREKLDKEYTAELEKTRKALPKGGRPSKEKPVQKIVPVKDTTKLTDHKIAEAIGTNRTYVNDARKIYDERPDLHEKVKAGKLTIPQAKAEIKRAEKTAELEQKAAAVQEEPSKRLWTLINDDVLSGLAKVKAEHGPARLIFTDPPYNIGVDYGDGSEADAVPHDDFIDWCEKWLSLCRDCLTEDGSLWLMTCDEVAAESCLILKDLGFNIRNWIKWYETFGVNCSGKFNRTSRHIFYATRSQRDVVWNPDAVSRPSDRQAKYNDKRAAVSGKTWDDVWQIPRLSGTCDERIPGFPTQLPLQLVEPIILCSSEPGDLVVDPFNGSGTTGIASIRNNRRYVGIDKSESFIDLATKRLVIG